MEMEILEIIKLLIRWVFDKKARLHLAGYRPEVVCLVKSTESPSRYMLIRPRAEPSIWVPPHEGINPDESIEAAAQRCLMIELGLSESNIQFRRSIWLGKRLLPENRWDERDLPYSLRGLLGKPRMIGKAYFGALVFVDPFVDIKPNGAEVHSWEWVNQDELIKRLRSNPNEKTPIFDALRDKFVELDNANLSL